MKMKGREA